MHIVAFTGKKGSGKDTAAEALKKIGYKHLSFADPLREITNIAYGVTYEEMTDPILKEKKLDRYPFMSPRELLTKLGTQAFRDLIDQQTWVKALERRAREHEKVVISDLRFLNEEKMLRANQGLIIRIINPRKQDNDEFTNHRSETEMDGISPDYTINNSGTIEQLHHAVHEVVANSLGAFA